MNQQVTNGIKVDFQDTSIAFAYKSTQELRKSWWLFKSMQYPCLVKSGPKFVNWALKMGLPVEFLLKEFFFKQFCGGTSLKNIHQTIELLGKYGVYTLLDYAVEGEKTEEGFEKCKEQLTKTIEFAASNPLVCASALKITGIGSFSVLENYQKNQMSDSDNLAFSKILQRLNEICKRAYELKQTVYIDAEESWIQDTIDELAEQMMEKYNHEYACVYTTIQCYRKDRLGYFQELLQKSQQKGYILGVKLVRGAYLEKENQRAKEHKYPSPMNPSKDATDKMFNLCAEIAIEHLDNVWLCAGTHNEESCQLIIQQLQSKKISPDDPRIIFAQLFGMSDHISFNLAKAGYRVAKYLPYGPVEKVLPYLFRRAEENSSVKGQSGREFLLIDKELKRRSKW